MKNICYKLLTGNRQTCGRTGIEHDEAAAMRELNKPDGFNVISHAVKPMVANTQREHNPE